MKKRITGFSSNADDPESIDWKSKKAMKRNRMRMGGGGLSLQSFANAKMKSDHHNPALIKKQREFYKNAKYVSKYKRSQKQHIQRGDPPSVVENMEGGKEVGDGSGMNPEKRKNKADVAGSLKSLYERKREEEERARWERKAMMQAKKEERDLAEAHRKARREKMFKRTRAGQPVMKYRIEHLLESLQNPKA